MITLPNGTLSLNKIRIVSFHLNNRKAHKILRIQISDTFIANKESTRFLGDMIDGSLTFKKYLEGVKKIFKSRNNIIPKLAGWNWGSNAKVLRTTIVVLVYSVAEYATHRKNSSKKNKLLWAPSTLWFHRRPRKILKSRHLIWDLEPTKDTIIEVWEKRKRASRSTECLTDR